MPPKLLGNKSYQTLHKEKDAADAINRERCKEYYRNLTEEKRNARREKNRLWKRNERAWRRDMLKRVEAEFEAGIEADKLARRRELTRLRNIKYQERVSSIEYNYFRLF